MSIPDRLESIETLGSSPQGTPTTIYAATGAKETAELISEISLTVEGPCVNLNGRYVGLNQGQREKLGVQVGETVELFDSNKSLGVFTVSTGSKKLLLIPGRFTANQVDAEKTVIVRARKNSPESDTEFSVQYIAEAVNAENHQRRQDIIASRLGMDPDVYVTIPVALATQVGIKPPAGKTIAPISKAKIIGVDGREHEIAVVPTGSSIGFTSKAAAQLGIPSQLRTIRLRADNEKLVIS